MRVLVVDDDIKQLELLRDAFRHFGVDVFLAHSVAEAERLYGEMSTSIGCVVTDVDLIPGGPTGLWFIEHVTIDLPALVVTGRGPDDPEVCRCIAARSAVTDCLGKPYSVMDIYRWYESVTSQPLRTPGELLVAS